MDINMLNKIKNKLIEFVTCFTPMRQLPVHIDIRDIGKILIMMISSAVFITVLAVSLVSLYLYYHQRPIGRLIRLKISIWTNLLTASIAIMMLRLKRLF